MKRRLIAGSPPVAMVPAANSASLADFIEELADSRQPLADFGIGEPCGGGASGRGGALGSPRRSRRNSLGVTPVCALNARLNGPSDWNPHRARWSGSAR